MHLAYNFVISKGKLCKLKEKETEEIRKFCYSNFLAPIFFLFYNFTIIIFIKVFVISEGIQRELNKSYKIERFEVKVKGEYLNSVYYFFNFLNLFLFLRAITII